MSELEQIRAGRALLGWSQEKLSRKSGYSLPAINNIERGIVHPRAKTLNALRQTLEKEGVEFTEGTGVRLRAKILNIKT